MDKTRTKFTLHQTPAVEQMQWVADLVTRHRVHPYGDEFPGTTAREVWNSGRIGMYVQISVYTNFNQAQFDWDIVPLPRGKTQVTRTASAGHSMTAASKNKDAAWEALKFLGSKPAYEHWAKGRADHPHLQGGGGEPAGAEPQRPAQERQDRHGRLRLRPPRADQRGLGQRGGGDQQGRWPRSTPARWTPRGPSRRSSPSSNRSSPRPRSPPPPPPANLPRRAPGARPRARVSIPADAVPAAPPRGRRGPAPRLGPPAPRR